MPFPLDLLVNLRQVVVYFDGRFVEHAFGSEYVKILETGDNYVVVGFEDLDKDLGYTPDYDYNNPRLKIYYVDGYFLFSIVACNMSFPVTTNTIFYKLTRVYEFTRPGTIMEPSYVLVDASTGRIAAFGDFLKLLIVRPPVQVVTPISWGENMVKVGTTMDLYATAESSGLTLTIVITKPDGTKIRDTMEDLGDGNYKYTFTFDQKGEYLIEIIYPDGFKRKKIVMVY